MGNVETARAFSGHHFQEAFDLLDDDVRWVLVGETVLEGRDAVIAACRSTAEHLVSVTASFDRFISSAEGDVVCVDAVGRYQGPDDDVTAVSSCDVYEFADGVIHQITSYTVEVDPPASP